MMIYVFPSMTGASVVYNEKVLTDEQKLEGIAIEALPVPQTPEGYEPVLMANKDTGEVWYDYREIAPTPKEVELEQRVADLELALAAMLGGAV